MLFKSSLLVDGVVKKVDYCLALWEYFLYQGPVIDEVYEGGLNFSFRKSVSGCVQSLYICGVALSLYEKFYDIACH